jgi:glucosamine-6-phosphate deaminase
VLVYRDRAEMGGAAASRAAECLRAAVARGGRARAVFASAPSQVEFLHALAAAPGVDWSRITAFHLDEYVGVPSRAPQAFGQFLRAHLFDRVRPSNVWFLDGTADDVSAEMARYAQLLREAPLDLACVGIGENGHLAFNEPGHTDFDDTAALRVVALDERSRLQQVRDARFGALEDVPARAITLTVPSITAAASMVCVVPGPAKRDALRRTIRGPVAPDCPASALRRHADAVLFADFDAAALL